jgi:hypothetical protein
MSFAIHLFWSKTGEVAILGLVKNDASELGIGQ